MGKIRIVGAPTAARLIGCVVGLLLVAPATSAQAFQSWQLGKQWADGLDTRLQAQRMGEMASRVGYASNWDLDGRNGVGAWGFGYNSQVFGVFGHSHAGFILSDENYQGLAGNMAVAAAPGLVPIASWTKVGGDDLLLAIFSGCYTGNTDIANGGNLLTAAKDAGVDAAVGYVDLVYSPTSLTDSSGNYYWRMVAYYLERGYYLRDALNQAVSDLRAKEGNPAGYDRYWIAGHQYAQYVTITPAKGGATSAAANQTTANGALVGTVSHQGKVFRDYRAGGGVMFREDDRGRLASYSAPASTPADDLAGSAQLTQYEAQQRAVAFAEQHVPEFSADRFTLVSSRETGHGDGESLFAFDWRLTIEGRPGPIDIVVEVDRRTGQVTWFNVARVTPRTSRFDVSRQDAITKALDRTRAKTDQLVGTQADVWDVSRWTVTVDLADPTTPYPDLRSVVVDAESGQVLGVTST